MIVTRSSFRKAVYATLALSIVGLALVCLPIVGPTYTAKFASAYWSQIAVGYVAMTLLIEIAGVPLRSTLCQSWAGALFAFCVFVIGVVAGSAVSMFLYGDMDAHSYIVKPLFWLGFYGFIPAAVIGAIGSAILRAQSKNGEQDAAPNP